MWYIYILECVNGEFYTGITNNLEKRIAQHNSGKGAKYTRGRLPVKLLAKIEVETKSLALKEEYRIKQLTKLDKIKLICLLKKLT